MRTCVWYALLWSLTALVTTADNDTTIFPPSEQATATFSSEFGPSNVSHFIDFSALSTIQSIPSSFSANSTVTIHVAETVTSSGPGLHFPPRLSPVHHHHQGSRWGPYFEDGAAPRNLTARVGRTVVLDCKIGMLHDKTVTWMRRKHNSMHLLTVGRHTYSSDQRFALRFRYPNNWRLEIKYVGFRDEGHYECQVATHPPLVKIINLTITAPVVMILDENSHEVSERYYKAGSALELTCLAIQVEEPEDPVSWYHGDATLSKGITLNSSLVSGILSATLKVEKAEKQHSGNYTCAVGNIASAAVTVHILNGELPAAVHHGNSGYDPLRATIILVGMCTVCHLGLCR